MINIAGVPASYWITLIAVAGCVLLSSGCKVVHLGENKPGHIDVTEAPEVMDEPARYQPGDPGGHVAMASARAYTGVATASRRGVRQRSHPVGAEVSFGAGRLEELRRTHGFLGPLGLHVIGGVLGGNFMYYSDAEAWRGRVYLEADSRILGLVRTSAGWSLQPTVGHHGPQVTLGFLHAWHGRWNWDIGHGWSATVGFSVPFYAIFVRSQ